MLTMRATTASRVTITRKRLGRMTPRGLANSARKNAAMSAPWVTSWPTVGGIGIKVGRPTNARTFAKSAAHAGSGLRRRAVVLARPDTARFAIDASAVMERRAPGIQARYYAVGAPSRLASRRPGPDVAP